MISLNQMEKAQRRQSAVQFSNSQSKQALEPAKPRFTGLFSGFLNKIQQGLFNTTEPSMQKIDDNATTLSGTSNYMERSESMKNLIQEFGRQPQTLSDNQRLSYQSDTRFSTISNDAIGAQHEQINLQQHRISLELSSSSIDDFSTVKYQFQTLMNAPNVKIYEFFPLQNIEERKKNISKLLIAYFHICNYIFKVIYSKKQVELVETIFKGSLEKVKQLLTASPELPHFQMKNTGYNLLYIASMSPHVDIVEYFLQKPQLWDIKQATSIPLNVAAWCGHLKVVQILMEYGMSPRARSKGQNAIAAEEADHTEIVQLLNGVNSYRLGKVLSQPLKEKEKEIIESIIEGKKNIDNMINTIQNDQTLLNFRSKYNNYSLLSIAIMSQNERAIQFILKTGCYFDITTCHTTPMHIAVESDNPKIVRLLLEYGLPFNVPDRFGYLPIQLIKLDQKDETHQKYFSAKGNSQNPKSKTLTQNRQQIFDLLQMAQNDKVNKLIAKLIEKGQLIGVINIFDDQSSQRVLIARKLLTKNYLRKFDKHRNAFHGTDFENLVDIVVQGLKKPGTKVGSKIIKSKPGNIQDGQVFNGQKDWNQAIFTTPSIYYACFYGEAESSKDLIANDIIRWKPVLQVKLENKKFQQYKQTTNKAYQPSFDDPILLEYVSKVKEGEPDKVIVVAIILLNEKYYEMSQKVRKFSYAQITELMLNGNDEKVVQMYLEAQKERVLNGQKGQGK